jgi:hypothetical protein
MHMNKHFGCLHTIERGERYIYIRGCIQIFRTGHLERELQIVQLSATRCSCIAILRVSLVSFAAIALCVASQDVFIFVVVYFVIDSIRRLLDTLSYILLYGELIFENNGSQSLCMWKFTLCLEYELKISCYMAVRVYECIFAFNFIRLKLKMVRIL